MENITGQIQDRVIKELWSGTRSYIDNIPEESLITLQALVKSRLDNEGKGLRNIFRLYIDSGGNKEDIGLDTYKSFMCEGITESVAWLLESKEFRSRLYEELYTALKEHLEKGNNGEPIDYSELFGETAFNVEESTEIFVRLVEEGEGVEITSWKQLQELTGLTALWNYWDKEKGFLSDEEAVELAKEQNKPLKSYKATNKQSKAEADSELEETFTQAMKYRYTKTLENMLEVGAKYKNLLTIAPSNFFLPDSYQEEAIVRAIGLHFKLYEPPTHRPDIGTVAERLQAPYPVIQKAVNTFIDEEESNE